VASGHAVRARGRRTTGDGRVPAGTLLTDVRQAGEGLHGRRRDHGRAHDRRQHGIRRRLIVEQARGVRACVQPGWAPIRLAGSGESQDRQRDRDQCDTHRHLDILGRHRWEGQARPSSWVPWQGSPRPDRPEQPARTGFRETRVCGSGPSCTAANFTGGLTDRAARRWDRRGRHGAPAARRRRPRPAAAARPRSRPVRDRSTTARR
jgi:hypothetical protein